MVLKEPILNSFYFEEGMVVLKELIDNSWTASTFKVCGGLQRSDFEQFLLSKGVVVFKELILNSFYFERVW